MKRILTILLFFYIKSHAQFTLISPGDTNSNIVTNTTLNGGLELPKLTQTQIQAITNPKTGTLVYDLDLNSLRFYNGNRWVSTNETNFSLQVGGVGQDSGNSIKFDKYGNLYILGTFSQNIDIGGNTLSSSGFTDIFIAKFNNVGNLMWAVKGGGNDEDYASDFVVEDSGVLTITGYYFGNTTIGSTNVNSNGNSDIFVTQILSNGTFNWVQSIGGQMNDRSTSISNDGNGNTYVAGFFNGTVNFNSVPSITSLGNSDALYFKLDLGGSVLWANRFGGPSSDYCKSIVADSFGNIYVTGTFSGSATQGSITLSNTNNNDYYYVAKGNPNGSLIWAKKGGGSGAFASGQELILDSNGNVLTTGDFGGLVTFDGITINASGSSVLFIAKYNPNGVLQSVIPFGNSTGASPKRMSKDNYGNIFITGFYSGSIQLGNKVFSSHGATDIFILKLNSSSNPILLQCGGGIGLEIPNDIATKEDGTTYIIGEFSNDMNLFGTRFIPFSSNLDCFVIKVF
ncbi:SBBP repeat-containing protein [Emticicia sp. SJ17W-69]|uniref:SBBP repeat-containing protein n=1 Tax=Emticicia sp. SJ17W-69 TaxID=3421657 RepID=UPI003EB6FDFA